MFCSLVTIALRSVVIAEIRCVWSDQKQHNHNLECEFKENISTFILDIRSKVQRNPEIAPLLPGLFNTF